MCLEAFVIYDNEFVRTEWSSYEHDRERNILRYHLAAS